MLQCVECEDDLTEALRGMWKKAVVIYLKILPQHLLGEIKIHGTLQSVEAASGPESNLGPTGIRNLQFQ